MQQHHITLALGSNTDSRASFSLAMEQLGRIMDITARTSLLTTEPIGIISPPFLNGMIKGTTPLHLEDIRERLKEIERLCGRTPEEKANGIIRMDIDIMEYDGEIYHKEDWGKKYIRQLLTELPDND